MENLNNEELANSIAIAVSEAISPLVDEIEKLNEAKTEEKIPEPKEDSVSVGVKEFLKDQGIASKNEENREGLSLSVQHWLDSQENPLGGKSFEHTDRDISPQKFAESVYIPNGKENEILTGKTI